MIKDDLVVSLFSGAGGFATGFSQAGLKPVFGVDINVDACQTYQHNVGTPCHQLDLSTVEPTQLAKLAGGCKPFVVIGGPPCQGFSTAGSRNANDPRNQLIFNYLNIVEKLWPRWFIFENVEGLLTSGGGKDIACLVRDFVAIGYSVRLQKVNFAAYGVPQTRKRVLIIGNRLGIDFQFPEELYSFDSGKSKKWSSKPMAPSVAEAIAGLGLAATVKDTLVPYANTEPVNAFDARMREGNVVGLVSHHVRVKPASQLQLELLRPGQTMKDLPREIWHASYERRANRRVSDGTPSEKRGGAPSGIKRLQGNLQSLTITSASTREFIHPTEHRPLTIRECARTQTFPDKYQWVGSDASVIQQIANAVPPLAAERLAMHLQEIDGSFGADIHRADAKAARLLGFVLTEADAMSPALKSAQALLAELHREGRSSEGNTTTT
jgi:DNA (cytosine-5)-methyltransferase 1